MAKKNYHTLSSFLSFPFYFSPFSSSPFSSSKLFLVLSTLFCTLPAFMVNPAQAADEANQVSSLETKSATSNNFSVAFSHGGEERPYNHYSQNSLTLTLHHSWGTSLDKWSFTLGPALFFSTSSAHNIYEKAKYLEDHGESKKSLIRREESSTSSTNGNSQSQKNSFSSQGKAQLLTTESKVGLGVSLVAQVYYQLPYQESKVFLNLSQGFEYSVKRELISNLGLGIKKNSYFLEVGGELRKSYSHSLHGYYARLGFDF